jgi:hypothetical protein
MAAPATNGGNNSMAEETQSATAEEQEAAGTEKEAKT